MEDYIISSVEKERRNLKLKGNKSVIERVFVHEWVCVSVYVFVTPPT